LEVEEGESAMMLANDPLIMLCFPPLARLIHGARDADDAPA